jgi:hypothetical protein
MTSEWMKVMLEEIERKLEEAAQARIERARREEEASKKETSKKGATEQPAPE